MRLLPGTWANPPNPMTIQFQVTDDDIRRGVRSDPCKCPVALAVQRRLKRPSAEVCSSDISWGQLEGHALPPDAVNWIARFDTRGRRNLKPFRFKMNLPADAVRKPKKKTES